MKGRQAFLPSHNGSDRIGYEWKGQEWIGKEWIGLERKGVDRIGFERKGAVFYARKNNHRGNFGRVRRGARGRGNKGGERKGDFMNLEEWLAKGKPLDSVVNADCLLGMKEMADCSVDLIFTSPPYGVGKDYGSEIIDDVPNAIKLILNMAEESERILVDGGKLLINVPHGIFRNPYFPFEGKIETEIYERKKLNYRGKILWFKGYLAGKTVWGSWKSPRDPVLRDYSESILVFCKGKTKQSNGRESDLTSEDFLEFTKTIWRISPETNQIHPAQFPIDLPYTAIKLYTFIGDLICDPFLGSGTTAVAAKILNRRFLGFEISQDYCAITEKRIRALPERLDKFVK